MLRRALGFTITELAEALGVSHTAVIRWERGEAVGGPRAILILDRFPEACSRLGLTEGDFLRGTRDRAMV
jgi:transcriptional regulator with XRE-family HTH domain